jgi:hypothetical protein
MNVNPAESCHAQTYFEKTSHTKPFSRNSSLPDFAKAMLPTLPHHQRTHEGYANKQFPYRAKLRQPNTTSFLQPNSALLSLPYEIRHKIWEDVLPGGDFYCCKDYRHCHECVKPENIVVIEGRDKIKRFQNPPGVPLAHAFRPTRQAPHHSQPPDLRRYRLQDPTSPHLRQCSMFCRF